METFEIPLDGPERTYTRDAVIKAIYHRLFLWLVQTINSALVPPAATAVGTAPGPAAAAARLPFIGVLDIFGFETFEVNTFETLLINHANEVTPPLSKISLKQLSS